MSISFPLPPSPFSNIRSYSNLRRGYPLFNDAEFRRMPVMQYPQNDLPFLTHCIVGYRIWNIFTPLSDLRYYGDTIVSHRYLISVSASNAIWPSKKPLIASCRRIEDYIRQGVDPTYDVHLETLTAPVRQCTCGIFAFNSLENLFDDTHDDRVVPKIVGTVALWGRICQHARGYRAQYAYPLNLVIIGSSAPLDIQIGHFAHYNVPINYTNMFDLDAVSQYII